ncbi:phage adaptor protein [Candidatus Puniceispirillum marinum]|uniref:Uncharacterized protein n=1 Tax=Puniceispirillum marinum (strain IMCC1322) TaxID=488538 RepID=D5BQB6_PUNMI|nr:hypothetical protein [Candidatus Puniceispirillum marinum]ADE38614.1 hypothetical protein SAR116_0371 [Candidatus Puniceispirillum marinum IMCC1322]
MNYGDLKTHFQDVLNRSDITSDLTTRFIDQGIARIQRQLRTPMSERVLEIAISSQTATMTLPSDFLEIISLYHSSNELERVSMRRFRELNDNNHSGKPIYFARQAEKIHLYPQPTDGTLVLYYHGEFPSLSADSDFNALTKAASDLVIYAGLTYASDYYLDQRAELFEQKFNQFLTEIQEQANDQELQGGTQSVLPSYRYDEE